MVIVFRDLEHIFGTLNTTAVTAANETYFQNSTAPPVHSSNKTVAKYYPYIVAEMFFSCLALVFSIVVYYVLPEFRNVHGKNLITMSICLLVTFLMLILDLIIRNYISFASCFAIAMIIHVTFLGNFFWTNVMAFDIWQSLTSMKAKGEVKSQSRKYLKYSVYAWTATVLVALSAAVLDLTDLVPKRYRPQFGVRRCWLNGYTAFSYYFNLPVGVILLCNLVMFSLTLRKLMIIRKMTAILNVKKQQKRLYLYLKLFLVMGITWTTEFIPSVTGEYRLYALAGMLTALHGCFLFFIFVCKKRILRQFFEKVRLSSNSLLTSQSTSSQQMTSSISTDTNKKFSIDKLSDSKF